MRIAFIPLILSTTPVLAGVITRYHTAPAVTDWKTYTTNTVVEVQTVIKTVGGPPPGETQAAPAPQPETTQQQPAPQETPAPAPQPETTTSSSSPPPAPPQETTSSPPPAPQTTSSTQPPAPQTTSSTPPPAPQTSSAAPAPEASAPQASAPVPAPSSTYTPTTLSTVQAQQPSSSSPAPAPQQPTSSAAVATTSTTPLSTWTPPSSTQAPTPSPTTSSTSTTSSSSTSASTSSAPTGASNFNNDQQFNSDILNEHNIKRALHGVQPLAWDDSLAEYSKNYASSSFSCDNVQLIHSHGPYGENLAAGYSGGKSPVDAWYDEIKDYNYNQPGFSEATGHFTQVVWKSTSRVGCARVICNNAWQQYTICEYSDTRGNVIGKNSAGENLFAVNVVPPLSSS